MEEIMRVKVVVLIIAALLAVCFMGVHLFIPQIFINIIKHEHPDLSDDLVASKASTYKSFMDGAGAIVQLFGFPILGSVSDIWGRKRVALISAVAQCIYLICIYIAYEFEQLWMMYIACLFYLGMAVQLMAVSFMSDIATDEKDKTKSFSYVMASFMGGIIVGSVVIGGIGIYSTRLALVTLVLICIILCLTILFAFHENSAFFNARHERQLKVQSLNPFLAVKALFGKGFVVVILVLIYALNFIAIADGIASGVLYAQTRYHWGSFENGLAGALKGISGVLWQAVGVPLILRVIIRENMLTIVMFASVALHAFQGFSFVGWMYMLAAVVSGFSVISFPMLQAIISEKVPKDQTGMALGALHSVAAIATLIGALICENLFAWCLKSGGFTCPGTAFYFSAAAFFIDGILCYVLFKKYPPAKEVDPATLAINTTDTADVENEGLLNENEDL